MIIFILVLVKVNLAAASVDERLEISAAEEDNSIHLFHIISVKKRKQTKKKVVL